MKKSSLLMLGQLLFALAYAVSPLPQWPILSLDPLIILFVYWVLHQDNPLYLGGGWLLGLLKDVLLGSLLGEHAFALTLVIYLLMKLAKRMRFFAIWQQALSVGALVLVNQLTIALLESLQGHFAPLSSLFYPTINSAVLWLVIHSFVAKEDKLSALTVGKSTR